MYKPPNNGLSVYLTKLTQPTFFSLLSSNPVAFSRYIGRESVSLFLRLVDELNPDIIHFDSIATFGLLELLPKNHSAKIILHSHDAVSRLYTNQAQAEGQFLRRFYLKQQQKKIISIEKSLYPKADICLVDSQEDAKLLVSLSEGINAQTLSLGFNENEFSPEGEKAKLIHPCVMMTGGMGSVQNIDAALTLCLDIMPKVWDELPDIQVYLVGSNPAPEVLNLKRKDVRIHVTGFVDDLSSYLRATDVYACTLKLGSGMRTRTIEALACGCAMVTTPEGVVGIDGDKAWEVANDDKYFALQIEKLLSDQRKVKELRINAIKCARTYSWTSVTKNLLKVYGLF